MKVLGGVVVETACAEFGWRPFLDTDLKDEDAPGGAGPRRRRRTTTRGNFKRHRRGPPTFRLRADFIKYIREWCTMCTNGVQCTEALSLLRIAIIHTGSSGEQRGKNKEGAQERPKESQEQHS